MRSIWKGAISFGLVNVPIKLYSATESHDVSLHQVHNKDGGRIRYQRRCEVCEKVVAYEDIDKAYDDGSKTVVLTDEDFKSLPAEYTREIEVLEFVPDDQIDPIRYDRSYFLEPEDKALKPYVLLRKALEDSDRTAIVTFALRQKTRLAALRVRDGVLILQTMLWDDEVRAADFPILDETVRISAKERDMAAQLVDSLASDFQSSDFKDDYQEQLRTLVEAKLEKGDAIDTEATFGEKPEEEDGGEVVDLMEALKRSVERKKETKKAASKPAKKSGRPQEDRQGRLAARRSRPVGAVTREVDIVRRAVLDDPRRHVAQLDVVVLRQATQEVERAIGVEVVALHQDALRLADQLARIDRDLQALFVVGGGERHRRMGHEDRGDRDVIVVECVDALGVEVERSVAACAGLEPDAQRAAHPELGDRRPPGRPAQVRGDVVREIERSALDRVEAWALVEDDLQVVRLANSARRGCCRLDLVAALDQHDAGVVAARRGLRELGNALDGAFCGGLVVELQRHL